MADEKKKNKISASLFGINLDVDVDEVLENWDEYKDNKAEYKRKQKELNAESKARRKRIKFKKNLEESDDYE